MKSPYSISSVRQSGGAASLVPVLQTQLGDASGRRNGIQEVDGSIPFSSRDRAAQNRPGAQVTVENAESRSTVRLTMAKTRERFGSPLGCRTR